MVKSIALPIKIDLNKLGNIDSGKLEKAISKYIEELTLAYYEYVKIYLVSNSTATAIRRQIMIALDQIQAICGGAQVSDDPTLKFSEHEGAVDQEIRSNLARIAVNIGPKSSSVYFEFLGPDFLGIGKEGDKTGSAPIQWLTYFLDGTLDDDLYWINTSTYKDLKGDSAVKPLGRFGAGHVWHIRSKDLPAFNRRVKKRLGRTASDLRHPQSGKAVNGRAILESAIKMINFEELVGKPAREAALASVKLNITI